ncbi:MULTISPECIES: hypothetical protein [Chryseobacterium]|uniref:Uncharacterized protein n=1 Tax=Chryseobacterium camelliae TaxID=1265445 RepID=A0ABU0TDY2_9FLAO|nr:MULTISPECIES: hypothetical protein [Chryseobacterium]MDT3406948.1 hypothetical protein [Pseudacidovorax intermedius]MDQ1095259.1 hypothetical protein [Chryseobacterium camelliae]MDQ1099197.1 hypothetical protein [Chryseobacterium sp. SORGH_AS_1048]MDR6086546.1 hypothetical protein [Chryseobacterium sp. SORGH_AS_0909]MDR6130917.1 hypothetical protein [Chryseobacterium sp. SORGH_AS_1175]
MMKPLLNTKKRILAASLLISGFAYSQVGINTSNPTKILDVNGDMRVRTLNTISAPNIAYVITADTDGNLHRSTPLDTMYSTGIYVKSTSVNNWNNIKVGAKGTKFDFTGRAAIGSGIDFTFSVFYDYGSGFSVVGTPVSQTSTSITVSGTSSTTFTVALTVSGTTYNFVYTVTDPVIPSTGLGSISVTNSASIGVTGSFVSLYHS